MAPQLTPYLHVLFECAWVASIIPGGQDTTIISMHAFGGYHMPLAVVIGIIGAMAGFTLNYGIGALLARFLRFMSITNSGYANAQRLFNKYGIFLLFFCWMFPGNIIVFIAGFLKTPARIAFPLIFAGIALHYGLLLRG